MPTIPSIPLIIVIEGVDQAGKKTQSIMLERALKDAGKTVRRFDFPDYTTRIGGVIGEILAGGYVAPQVLHCLMTANHWEAVHGIRHAKHDVLVMNRYVQSNLVYGMVNGMPKAWLENLDDGMPKADIVILLDIPPEESFRRRKKDRDVFESDLAFLSRVSEVYRSMAEKRRWRVVDATGTTEDVHARIMNILG